MPSIRQGWNVAAEVWRTQLWPVPTLCVVLAVGLGVVLPRVDARIDDDLPDALTAYLFSGGPEAARTVLSAAAGSLITVTSLTFSLTVVTLQLASSQYSPRLLRTFTRDPVVHLCLGLLLATFTYALTVLRTVRASLSEQTAFVPQISVTVAFALTLASVLILVGFLAHLSRQLRVEWMLRQVHAETNGTIRRVLPGNDGDPAAPAAPPNAALLCATSSGFLTSIDEPGVLAAAARTGTVVVIDRRPGDSLVAGTPIASAWRDDGQNVSEEQRITLTTCLGTAVRTGFERTATQDVAFGVRQLVDVVVKALSPGVNDPTTAVHGLGHVAAVMCELGVKDLGPRLLRDDEGQVRVVLSRPDFDELLELAVAQPCRYGAAEPAVLSRLLAMLREIAWTTTDPARRAAVGRQLDRLAGVATRPDLDPAERDRLDDQARTVREALAGRWTA
ncbi:DUF2254 domain-containing protein [Actinoplanes sp. TRM 88003]|uniref:DUF2254 domain-containing protein n=1 Tax=Paractinoplanes aksuensis TaxID=2939490 RepID=A0ABT1E3F1_9ACTN|nr:DUF2254 domain-containing protein [Actinoplanes aksuensis]MCO8277666.1 DUF2254 domain-containing protein [Actinoplanes aksuensis]